MIFPPTPTPTAPPISANQYTETINAFANLSIGMAALFVLALFGISVIAYVYYNRNKGQGENAMLITFSQAMGSTLKERDERIDSLEAKEAKREEMQNEGLMAVGDGLNRIADLWTAQQKRETERDRILSDAASAMTAIVTTGSKPLQQVVKDMREIEETNRAIRDDVSKMFNRFMVIFPTDKPMEAAFEVLKAAILDALERACQEKAKVTQELPAVNIVNTVNTPAPDAADAGAKAGDVPGSEKVA